ncbi:MAG: N-acetyltransferase [Pleurocapsa sp. MO_192.B19]|nr:N-acetyltransferase [Pleurocapsa sp. MO_192.B19]
MLYIIRPIEETDEPFLSEILYQALYIPPGASPLPRDIILRPELAKYIQDWGRKDDIGFIAALKPSQILVGAAWLRLFTSNNPGYGYIDDNTPELSIAVLPKYRAQGIGTKLLTELLCQARSSYSAVSLSVLLDNPALRLYRRFGFEVFEQHDNSLTMIKDLERVAS